MELLHTGFIKKMVTTANVKLLQGHGGTDYGSTADK
jgi:hypothetical protein